MYSYRLGRIANIYSETGFYFLQKNGENGFSAGSQDGWINAPNNCSAFGRIVNPGGGNRALAIYCPKSISEIDRDKPENKAFLRHRIGNAFTNGFVEVSVDLRATRSPMTNEMYSAWVFLGDEDMASTLDEMSETYYSRFACETGIGQRRDPATSYKTFKR